jgi:hypothetical protein
MEDKLKRTRLQELFARFRDNLLDRRKGDHPSAETHGS